jgi:hypothetical protein
MLYFLAKSEVLIWQPCTILHGIGVNDHACYVAGLVALKKSVDKKIVLSRYSPMIIFMNWYGTLELFWWWEPERRIMQKDGHDYGFKVVISRR